MNAPDRSPNQIIQELEKENASLRREIDRLKQEQARLERVKERFRQERDRFKHELDLARRAAKRQAAPFSKGEPKANPKRPGRKPGKGYGRKARRAIPTTVDEEIQVPLPDRSPCCSGQIGNQHVEDQYQTEIVRKTHVTRFRIHVGTCMDCGARVQSRDPRQTSDALGAAASQVGPEALSLAAILNKELGIPLGKTTTVLDKAFGLSLTPGGLSQALARMGAKCEPTYDDLIRQVRASASVTMDESGWKVGGHRWWLWVAVTDDTTVYGILPGRGYDEAVQLLGAEFDGVIVHDGWSVYYQFESAFHQTCNRHLINRCNEMLETASPGAVIFPQAVKSVLLKGLDLRDRYAEGEVSDHGLASATGRLEAEMDMLVGKRLRLEENRRLAKHLSHEFDHLFSYLHCPGLEATNWRGEQAIRPAVVARKVWGGNRTQNGARVQEVLTSVLRTSRQRGTDSLTGLAALLRLPRSHILDFNCLPRASN